MRSPLHRDPVGGGPGPEAGAGPPLLGDPLLYAVALIAALLYAAARLSSDNRPLAALLSIAWAVRVPWENSHHWFTTAASMAAAVGLLLALDGAPRRGAAFFAGLFAGAAAMVTP